MLKRIIFDLDNTLIEWKDEYTLNIKNVLEKHNIDVDYMVIDGVIESMEVKYDTLSKEQLYKDICHKIDNKITMDILDEILIGQQSLSEYDEKMIDLMKYLSSKYEIVVLTNYFTYVQEGRLKHAGILPYIKKVYGGDIIPKIKPDASGFIMAMGDNIATECLFVGDSIIRDINGAKNLGIPTILVDLNDKYKDYKDKKIKSVLELKEML